MDADAPAQSPRFDHTSWLTLALALLLVLGSLALAGYRLAQPDDAIRLWLDDGSAPPGGLPTAGDGRALLTIDDRGAMAMLTAAMLLRPDPPPGWQIGGRPTYQFQYYGGRYQGGIPLGRSSLPRFDNWLDLGQLLYLPIGLFVFWRRPRLAAAQALLLFAAITLAAVLTRMVTNGWSELRMADLLAPGAFWPTYLFSSGLFWLPLAHFALVFPRPKRAYLRHPALALALIYGLPLIWLAALATWSLATAQPLRFFSLAARSSLVLIAAIALGMLLSLAHSYRHAHDAAERAQVAWGGLGLAIFCLWAIALLLAIAGAQLGVIGSIEWLWNLSVIASLAPPICLMIAILRYRLFEIDLVINRALVYGALTLSLAAIVGAIIGALGLLVQGSGSWPLTLLALAVAGALAHPLSQRLQRWVNRAMYGERDRPYAALARLSERLGGMIEPDAVLTTIVCDVAATLRLPYMAITHAHRDLSAVPLAAYRSPQLQGAPCCEQFALRYQGQQLGWLLAAPRMGEAQLGAADMRLLRQLAAQAGAAVYAANLTAELRRSREHLVAAREEERRRLQRDIHDGLGPTLAGMTLKIDAARNLLTADPQQAAQLLGELRGQTQGAVDEIRRLVYALRPPKLDQLGLLGAIEDLAELAQPQLAVELELPPQLPALPAAVEVAAYRIAQEALTNAARHSAAWRCRVRLAHTEHALLLEIQDDGRGLPAVGHGGIGLRSMVERAQEIGGDCRVLTPAAGGTLVCAHLPLERR